MPAMTLLISAIWLMPPSFSTAAESNQAGASQRSPTSQADIERWMDELSNWGRWGQDDQLGAINLITAAKRKQAAALVKDGFSVSLATDARTDKAVDNPSPYEHVMLSTGAEGTGSADRIAVAFHGLAHTHLDALCHIFYKGKMYNGYPQEEVTAEGCGRNGILNLKSGIVTRGILLDIPRLKGVEFLEPGTPIYAEDLEAWEKQAGIRVGSGDVIFVRTGRWARQARYDAWNVMESTAGLHASVAKWLKARGVAMVGGDAANDVAPAGIQGAFYPLHSLAIAAMGIHLFDNCDLEALAKAAAERGRWEFMLTVAPIAMPGGTGSPVNPIATF
jgi:kynurenine formamidase